MANRLMANDLYSYLLSLAKVLEAAGELDIAARAMFVSKFASGSTSELYGEALALLSELLRQGVPRLSGAETARLRDVVERIEDEFRRIGGA